MSIDRRRYPGLITLMKLLGYPVEEKGVCHGYSMMAVLAILQGERGHFLNRINLIDSIDPTCLSDFLACRPEDRHAQLVGLSGQAVVILSFNKTKANFAVCSPLIFDHNDERSPDQQINAMLESIPFFCDGVQLYQSVSSPDYRPLFEKQLIQSNYRYLSKLLSSEKMEQRGGLELAGAFSILFSKENVVPLVKKIIYIFDMSPGSDDVVLSMRSSINFDYGHRIVIAFDKEKKQFVLLDANDTAQAICKTDDVSVFCNTIANHLLMKNNDKLFQCIGCDFFVTGDCKKELREQIDMECKSIFFDLSLLYKDDVGLKKWLQYAVLNDEYHVIEYLISMNMDVNNINIKFKKNNLSLLTLAIHGGAEHVASVLINNGINMIEVDFKLAYSRGQQHIIRLMLAKKLDVDLSRFDLLFRFLRKNNVNSLSVLKIKYEEMRYVAQFIDGKWLSLVEVAAREKSINQKILNYFYSISQNYFADKKLASDALGYTLLHWAILCHQPRELIITLINQHDKKDSEVLLFALTHGHESIAELLLDSGWDVQSAYAFALEKKQYVALPFLVKHRADHRLICRDAINKNDKSLIEYLIAHKSFYRANLSMLTFTNINLQGADLSCSDLTNSYMINTRLIGVDFYGALLNGVTNELLTIVDGGQSLRASCRFNKAAEVSNISVPVYNSCVLLALWHGYNFLMSKKQVNKARVLLSLIHDINHDPSTLFIAHYERWKNKVDAQMQMTNMNVLSTHHSPLSLAYQSINRLFNQEKPDLLPDSAQFMLALFNQAKEYVDVQENRQRATLRKS